MTPAPDSPRYTLPFLHLAATASRLFWCIISIIQHNWLFIISTSPFYVLPSLSLLFKWNKPPHSLNFFSPFYQAEKHSKPTCHWIYPAYQLDLSSLWKVSLEFHWMRMRKSKFIPLSGFMGNQSQNPTSYPAEPLRSIQTQVSNFIFNFD